MASVYAPLQRYLRRRTDAVSADDILGDVLLVMWRRVDDIPADAALAWCYGVARGCLANSVRRAQRQQRLLRRLSQVVEPPVMAASDDPDLDEALAALPAADREVLRLWAWEQLAHREIAVVLDTTPNAVSIRLHRATRRLREQLTSRKDGRSERTSRSARGNGGTPVTGDDDLRARQAAIDPIHRGAAADPPSAPSPAEIRKRVMQTIDHATRPTERPDPALWRRPPVLAAAAAALVAVAVGVGSIYAS